MTTTQEPQAPRKGYDPDAHTVADEIARALHDAGIREIFGQSCPTALMLAAERLGIRQIGYRTENAGAAMADAYARASGQITCIGAQNGPAATLLVPGMAEAYKASVPMLALVQDVHRRQVDKNAFQEFDHRALFSSCSVWYHRLTEETRAYEFARKSIIAATSGRPGPAVLMLPMDILTKKVEKTQARQDSFPLGRFPMLRTGPAPANIDAALNLLLKAERPLIVAGGGTHSSDAHAALAQIRDRLAVPVATTNMGKGAVDETHPLAVGVIGSTMGTRSPARHMRAYISQADVVFFAGNRTNENGTAAWKLFPEEATFIHADIDPYETQRNYTSLPLVGDMRTTLEAMLERLDAQQADAAALERRADRIAVELAPLRRKAADDLAPYLAPGASELRPERLVREIERHAPEDSIFVADASYSTLWLTQFLTCRTPGRRYLSPRGLAGLGWGYPMALGAKLAQPNRTVVALVGDGGFAHCWAELECAMRHGIDVKLVVLNNAVLGFQRNAELGYFREMTDVCQMLRIDHTRVAAAVDCPAWTVRGDNELEEVLSRAFAEPGSCLIDAMVDPAAFPPVTAFEPQLDH
ncbi:acetolactate synthase catalytic subunit [Roseovarius nanhaiticus]|uniref:acetolactate synthase catalytic subunit n=1 Tax=Roseovarius nanhaiticus TaxID=573024 RepID=UPI00248FFE18|nr:acetolactate synthase catalytic subunit [Roseovarius nanhaiticus]